METLEAMLLSQLSQNFTSEPFDKISFQPSPNFRDPQESPGPDGGGAQGACDEDEEDGGRNGAGVRDEGEREEAETEGLRG